MHIRHPVVAGQFYPANPKQLTKEIIDYKKDVKKQDIDIKGIKAIIAPHAGYMYSGKVAAEVYTYLPEADVYILIGPNHSGYGTPASIIVEGIWETPLGKIEIDNVLANDIVNASRYLKKDISAHSFEHSLEVQLPFIQVQLKDKPFKIIPICLMIDEIEAYQEIGKAVADNIINTTKIVVLIASTDMTHYESHEVAQRKDKYAIDAILSLDEVALIDNIKKHNISMCGYSAVAVVIVASKILGAKAARLIRYQTSGDVSGDYSRVVGYAGMVIS